MPILGRVADLPFAVPGPLRRRVLRCADVEGKLPRALDALGPIADRDVLLHDADGGWRARQLAESGARVVALVPNGASAELGRTLGQWTGAGSVTVAAGTALATGRPDASADVVVSFWSAFRGGADAEVAEADRVLRPGGRLLVVHDYGRDDLSRYQPDARSQELVAWSRRDGWFLTHGFKVRVIHAFWTFTDVAEMERTIAGVFGKDAPGPLADARRPRLSWKLVVYHRTREDPLGIA